MKRNSLLSAGILLLALFVIVSRARSQDQSQQGQDQTQQGQGQGQQAPDQQQQPQQQKSKKKGGFFSGFKAITGQSTEQGEATASAGSKSVGEGQKIGDVHPTAADRKKVGEMENYSIPDKDLKKFQEDGQVQPRK